MHTQIHTYTQIYKHISILIHVTTSLLEEIVVTFPFTHTIATNKKKRKAHICKIVLDIEIYNYRKDGFDVAWLVPRYTL